MRSSCVSPCLAFCFVLFFLSTVGILIAWAVLTNGFADLRPNSADSQTKPRRLPQSVQSEPKDDAKVCTSKPCVIVGKSYKSTRFPPPINCLNFFR